MKTKYDVNQSFMLLFFMVIGFVMFLFLQFPIVNVILITSSSSLVSAFFDPQVQFSIFLSFYTAGIATLIAFLLGTPLAYVLARRNFPFKETIDSLIDIPILLPHTVAGIALLTLFGEAGILGQLFKSVNIRFIDTIFGIIIAQLFVSSPFYIKTVRESFEKIDPRYHNVARTLGATPSKAFVKVEFPLAAHSMVSGAILCWARAISEFGAVIILAYYPPIASILIYQRFVSYGLSSALPVTTLLIFVTVIIFVIIRLVQTRFQEEYK